MSLDTAKYFNMLACSYQAALLAKQPLQEVAPATIHKTVQLCVWLYIYACTLHLFIYILAFKPSIDQHAYIYIIYIAIYTLL